MNNLSSLFSLMARGESDPHPALPQIGEHDLGEEKPKTLHFDVPCPWCLSDDTKPKNKAMDIYECSKCGEVFARPLG